MVTLAHGVAVTVIIGIDLGGQPGHVPPIIENRPCVYHFLPHNILICPSNIFDKSTPVTVFMTERTRSRQVIPETDIKDPAVDSSAQTQSPADVFVLEPASREALQAKNSPVVEHVAPLHHSHLSLLFCYSCARLCHIS